jgi:multidrug efflux pump subunit AcrA (membrane-fusion protein)
MAMKRWLNRSAIGSVVFLVALYLVLFNRFGPERWHGLVWKLRRPGQMSVVEALTMEMEAMKPPEGVLPVATEIVKPRPFEIAVTYTGTVVPLNEELVIARVTGRLTWMPYYAGDRIRKGQLVARVGQRWRRICGTGSGSSLRRFGSLARTPYGGSRKGTGKSAKAAG